MLRIAEVTVKLWVTVCLLWLTCLPASEAVSPGEEEYLDPEQAFVLDTRIEADAIVAHWKIADGYHLYRDKLAFALSPAADLVAAPQLPAGEIHEDEFFGKVAIYHHELTVRLPFTRTPPSNLAGLQLKIDYQGCATGMCYPPISKLVSLSTSGPTAINDAPQVAPQSEQDTIASTLAGGNIFWILLSFFGFGLLLALTPCVFPMIPILSGIIVGQGKDITTRKAFIMSVTYVLAMAFAYSIAGVVAGMVGENIQAAFQNPWALGAFAAVFVALSLSMFGFYDLQLPSALQSKLTTLSNRQSGGTLIGVAIMGFLSALIVGPCVAAPLAGALIYIGQSGDAVLGGLALFALSLGMGVPLIIIGTSAGKLLPRAGGWMEAVKYVFGVMLLGVAVWMLERVLPAHVVMLLYALLLILPAVYLGALDSLPTGVSGWRKLWKGVGVVMLLSGTTLLLGAAAGSSDLLHPLQAVHLSNAVAADAPSQTEFKPITNLAELDQALTAAQATSKPVVLDFYADWCVACKEMEHYTFADPKVQQALGKMTLLQVDVTANNADHKALFKRFGLFGPPAMIFYDAKGQEQKSLRLVGFKPAPEFLTHIQQVL